MPNRSQTARPHPAGERLQKVLAHAGIASRRAAEQLILDGRVAVNGAIVTELGTRVDPAHDTIDLDGQPLGAPRRSHQYLLLHKPLGVVTSAFDPQGRPTVVDLVGAQRRLYPVGRLDLDSEGLVLMTDDGEMTYRLTQARYGVEKDYHALVRGVPSRRDLWQLCQGVWLEDGLARAVRAWPIELAPRDGGAWVGLALHEGRKRQVRRMLAAIGAPVQYLVRVRLGPLSLGDLPEGEYRPLTRGEVAALRRQVGLT